MYKSAKFWNRTANSLENQNQKAIESHNKSINAIQKHLNKSDLVIDLGCATGAITLDIANSVKQIYGLDISYKMIEIARENAVKQKLENIEFIISSLHENDFKKESVDVIICYNVLHLVDDIHKTILKIKELLKPEGIMISSTVCVGEKPFVSKFFTFLGYTGLFPKIRSFKVKELNDLISSEFNVVESKIHSDSFSNLFCVAKKAK